MFQLNQQNQPDPSAADILFNQLAQVQKELDALDDPLTEANSRQQKERQQIHQQIKSQLVEANSGLVHWVVNEYYYQSQGNSMTREDLVQEGFIGLIKAVDKFDLSYDTAFSTYAQFWIRQAISRGLEEKAAGIRLPADWIRKQRQLNSTDSTADDFRSKEPKADLTAQQRKQLQQAPELLYECHLSRADRDKETSALETAPSLCAGPEEQVVQAEDQQRARVLLNRAVKKCLTSREAEVIQLRFGLADQVECSAAQTGQQLGLSRQRVRQLESAALTKLRRLSRPEFNSQLTSASSPQMA